MFDISWTELVVIGIVALIVIGPNFARAPWS
jgi:Sec-independent protein translocase protein TatA